jgi:hypothetical protein
MTDWYEYRVEYNFGRDDWMGADGLVFETEGMAEAHMNRLTNHVYDARYRVTRRKMPRWEAFDA